MFLIDPQRGFEVSVPSLEASLFVSLDMKSLNFLLGIPGKHIYDRSFFIYSCMFGEIF
jgi:hypothetical protein